MVIVQPYLESKDAMHSISGVLTPLLVFSCRTNVFARSKYLQLRRPENILWATHGVLCFTMLLGLVTLLGVVAGYLKTHKDPSIPPAKRGITLYQTKFRVWESWWIIASAVVILTGTILFGVGVARSLSKMQLISDFLKRQASKVRLLLIITFTGIVLKVVYNLAIAKAVNQWRRKNPSRTKENSFAAIFFFYLFLTDIVPIIFVLVVFISPRKYKRSGSGREYAQYSEDILDHTNSSDGLLSNDESY